jgi:beta-galactosidase
MELQQAKQFRKQNNKMMYQIFNRRNLKPAKRILLFCLLGLASAFIVQELNAQQTYTQVFNPMNGFVNETEKPFRDELCLNGKWQFMPVYENDISKFIKPATFNWEPVPLKVPSPWNVNAFSEGDGGDFVAFPSYPKAWEKARMGWMKKEFVLPEGWEDKQLKLHFEAIAGFAKIYINGQLASENLDIFFPTELDVTSLLKKGTNEILVGVAKASLIDIQGKYGRRNYVAGSFWGQHIAGIWQDVSLIAVPELSISDVFVQPDVQNDQLNFAVTLKNNTKKTQSVNLHASVRSWEEPATTDVNRLPVDNGVLKDEVLMIESAGKIKIKVGDSIEVKLSKKVDGKLKNWTPDSPYLYGAVISLNTGKKTTADTKYTRFGWRQFLIKGTELQLNGKPIVLKGDSWHFMGIPQMTRRYAWGWFSMLKDANANAVRLHAQPYPSFYLDMADEMGICVLDETGIWSSDGGPKMDSDDYWIYCKKHVKSLVMRDRNHPAVFGWSVCNETVPVVINVFHAPESIVQRQINEINNWIKIVRNLDSTRDWISGDGEDMRPTDLPTVIGHYGNEGSMKKWSSEGKPWGVGETGMGYYGSPKQISVINGNRAYESQQGRMEGLAMEAYGLIGLQQKYKATYTSVFNVVWYGIKPLEFGLRDTTRAPKPEDGIFFPTFQEGIPGVQPERIGPYTSTINPGYDSSLPLYKPWPLFYAVQAINSSPVKPFAIEPKVSSESTSTTAISNINEVGMISGVNSVLKNRLSEIGVPFVENVKGKKYGLIVVDGSSPLTDSASKLMIDDCLKSGGKILVWGVSPESLENLNHLLNSKLELTERKATSFIKKQADLMIGTLDNKDFYFSEMMKLPVMKYGLSGETVRKGEVLLEACKTDWNRWNGHGENIKTAAVYRSEREAKAEGAAMVKVQMGAGQIYLSSVDLFLLKSDGEELLKTLFRNLGVSLKTVPLNSRKALSPVGSLEQAIVIKGTGTQSDEIGKMGNQQFTAKYESADQPEFVQTNTQGFLDLSRAAGMGRGQGQGARELFLSFWVFSPRSMVNLLVEPDMPKLEMVVEGRLDRSVFVNGVLFATEGLSGKENLENLPLEKGWNHVLVRIVRDPESRRWQTRISLKSNKEDYFKQLNSSVGQ